MEDLLSDPVFWIVFSAVSEIIALSPWKYNSVIQVVLTALRSLKKVK